MLKELSIVVTTLLLDSLLAQGLGSSGARPVPGVSRRGFRRAFAVVLVKQRVGLKQLVTALLRELFLAVGGATLIAGGARIRVVAPFTPVPFTLQTMSLHYLLFTLGRRAWKPVLAYIALGLAGLPFFAFGGGPAYVLSPTFGYIVGFLAGTAVAGWIAPSGALSLRKCFVAGFVQLGLVYLFGVTWLATWYSLFRGLALLDALLLATVTGLAPFVVWDVVKVLSAIPIARATVVLYLYFNEK